MPPAKLHLAIAPSFLEKLRTIAAEAGLPVDDYAAGVIQQHAMTGGLAVNVRRPVGRPVSMQSDDLPDGIERAATASGFAGVTKYGRQWQAKVGGTVLGRFSSADLAASIRHYTLLGFRVGRGAYLSEVGLPLADAMHFAVSAVYDALPDGGAALATLRAHKEASPLTVSPKVTSALTAVALSTPKHAAELEIAKRVFSANSLQCPTCGDMLINAMSRRIGVLCELCAADFDAWDKLPASGEPPAPRIPEIGETWAPKGAATSESFVSYVTRMRKERA